MDLAVIDTGGWQVTLSLKEGKAAADHHPLLPLARKIIAAHPYPKDVDIDSARWVTEVALELHKKWQPQYIMLVYATPFFAYAFRSMVEGDCQLVVDQVFQEIERFLSAADFSPVIVGMGDMELVVDKVNLLDFEGIGVAGGPLAVEAGLFHPSPQDLNLALFLPGIQKIVDRDVFQQELGGNPLFYQRFPDRLLLAEDGFIFRGIGSLPRPVFRRSRWNREIPLASPLSSLKTIEDLTQIAPAVLQELSRGKKVALILVEGVGCASFPLPCRRIRNTHGWYCYPGGGHNQYWAVTAGLHLTRWFYPPGMAWFKEDLIKPYPFSGPFSSLPETIGRRFRGKSAAVGNRSIYTHVFSGCQITIECFARALYNQGVMAVLRELEE
ncbi:MAG TPA: hypothetical protein ENM97_01855 [Moorella mulderi]|nr:hypothetical protein [Moorella mulderi]